MNRILDYVTFAVTAIVLTVLAYLTATKPLDESPLFYPMVAMFAFCSAATGLILSSYAGKRLGLPIGLIPLPAAIAGGALILAIMFAMQDVSIPMSGTPSGRLTTFPDAGARINRVWLCVAAAGLGLLASILLAVLGKMQPKS